ncbi:MAG: alanine racemase [bacterium]
MRRAFVRIDLEAIRHNVEIIRAAAPGARVMAVVKANAYGHGLEAILPALEAVDGFGVGVPSEAEPLSKVGVGKTTWVLQGALSTAELALSRRLSVVLVVSSDDQIELLDQGDYPNPVWLKLDTGMGRLGFSNEGFIRAKAHLGERVSGVMSHLACADEPDHPQNEAQLKRFADIAGGLDSKVDLSLANSAATFAFPESHYQWVRPGIALYGLNPVETITDPRFALKPAMEFFAPLIVIREMEEGDTVGYGCDWVCPRDMRVGIVAAGYADGYPRRAKGVAVALRGVHCAVLGRVSMDMIAVDLSHITVARAGDNVELWGKNITVAEVARCAETIPYELLCNAGNLCRTKEYLGLGH